MKIVIAPDKFKDTFSAREITSIISQNLKNIIPGAEITEIPLADGGEGTAEISAPFFNAKPVSITVNNPVFEIINTNYFFSETKKTAIIEISAASGLHLLKKEYQNPLYTSSYGTGELIADAVKKGAKNIFLTLGGSATNDAGCGAASALGFVFKDKSGKNLKINGKNLIKIAEISNENLNFNLRNINFIALYDVKNPLYGKNGAAYVFAKQKGASLKDTELLDKGLRNFADIVQKKYGININNCNGCGAAGGFGAGSKFFFNAELKPGAETLLELVSFDNLIKNADLIITGEGKFDAQSLRGKLTGTIIKKAEKFKIPVAVICGISDINVINKNCKVFPLFKKFPGSKKAKELSTQHINRVLKEIIY